MWTFFIYSLLILKNTTKKKTFFVAHTSCCRPITLTANCVCDTWHNRLYEFQTSVLWLVQPELVALPLRTTTVYSEDCHCGRSKDSGGNTYVVMLQWLCCVFSHESSSDLKTVKPLSVLRSKQGIAWSFLMNRVETALRRLFIKTQHVEHLWPLCVICVLHVCGYWGGWWLRLVVF